MSLYLRVFCESDVDIRRWERQDAVGDAEGQARAIIARHRAGEQPVTLGRQEIAKDIKPQVGRLQQLQSVRRQALRDQAMRHYRRLDIRNHPNFVKMDEKAMRRAHREALHGEHPYEALMRLHRHDNEGVRGEYKRLRDR